MIDKQRLMDETRDGLDILLDLYPQAKDCVDNKNKQFKMRLSEKTASAEETISSHESSVESKEDVSSELDPESLRQFFDMLSEEQLKVLVEERGE